jgi:hypothetical protein
MQRTIDLDQVRVVQADNYRGNPRVYLEIMDQRVLYTDPYILQQQGYDSFVKEDESGSLSVDTDWFAELFRSYLARMFADYLMAKPEVSHAWSRDTDRRIDFVKPRLYEVDDKCGI